MRSKIKKEETNERVFLQVSYFIESSIQSQDWHKSNDIKVNLMLLGLRYRVQ